MPFRDLRLTRRSCAPSTLNAGDTTVCTSTVADVDVGAQTSPAGTVTWLTNSGGSFATSTCTLSGSGTSTTCQVSYTRYNHRSHKFDFGSPLHQRLWIDPYLDPAYHLDRMPAPILDWGMNEPDVTYHPYWRNSIAASTDKDVLVSLWQIPREDQGRVLVGDHH